VRDKNNFENLEIEFDAKDAVHKLDLIDKDMNKIARRMMSKVFAAIRKDVRNTKLKGQVLKKKSGNLYKNIRYKAKADFTGYINDSVIYASHHELGYTILPKAGKYLTFKTEDGFRSVKQAIMPKRPFLGPVFYDYFNTRKAEELMDKIMKLAFDEITNGGNNV